MANSRLCTIPDCGKPLLARGLCSGHYQRIQKKGYVRPARPCSVKGCSRQFHAQGCCVKHYKRLLKYGDPLAGSTDWGAVQNYLADLLRAEPVDACISWPYSRSPQGAGQIRIKGRLQLVSRIVCEHRHGPPPTPKHEAAHLCGKGHEGCVSAAHLVWKTPSENQADKLLHGTHNRGERHIFAQLTEANVRYARASYAADPTYGKQISLARELGVAGGTMRAAITGKTWAWIKE